MSSVTRVYCIRHGETDFNAQGRVQGSGVNGPINQKGQKQAHALAEKMATVPIDLVGASSLIRAVQTAEIIKEKHPSAEFLELDGFREMNFGVYEGLEPKSEYKTTGKTVDDHLEACRVEWRKGNTSHRVEEGENIDEVLERVMVSLNEIVKRKVKTALVVTHGRLLKVLLSHVSGIGLTRMDEIDHSNTGVNIIDWDGEKFSVGGVNIRDHLQD